MLARRFRMRMTWTGRSFACCGAVSRPRWPFDAAMTEAPLDGYSGDLGLRRGRLLVVVAWWLIHRRGGFAPRSLVRPLHRHEEVLKALALPAHGLALLRWEPEGGDLALDGEVVEERGRVDG